MPRRDLDPSLLDAGLLTVLLFGSARRWCANFGCTTCGSHELRQVLGVVRHPDDHSPLRVEAETAHRIANELRLMDPDSLEPLIGRQRVEWLRSAGGWLVLGLEAWAEPAVWAAVRAGLDGSWSSEAAARHRRRW